MKKLLPAASLLLIACNIPRGPAEPIDPRAHWPADEPRLWRLAQIAFGPPRAGDSGRGADFRLDEGP